MVDPEHLAGADAGGLAGHGAVLFRGFGVDSAAAFAGFARRWYDRPMDYQDRASRRSQVHDAVYTSTDTAAAFAITLHSESTFTSRWPRRLLFCCLEAAASGGATPLACNAAVYRSIDAALRARFEALGVMYVRHFGPGVGMDWRDVFQVNERDELEAYCTEAAIAWEWLGDDRLRTVQVRPATVRHPDTGETLWFNHALALHASSLDRSLRQRFERDFGTDLPHQTYFGDGTPIDDADMQQIREAYAANTIRFDWRAGDVLLLDNMRFSHGRDPYCGARQVLAVLADPMSWQEAGTELTTPRHRPQPSTAQATSAAAHPQHVIGALQPAAAGAQWLIGYLEDQLDTDIDVDRSFVDLGGDSMLAVDLLDELFETFGVDLSIEAFMEAERLSDVLAELRELSTGH